jgi:uncharacterized membrane protein
VASFPSTQNHQNFQQHVFWIAAGTGAGFMGTLDAIVFHHLLRWHNFFVHSGETWRSVSDGLLHILTTVLLCAGFVLLWRRRQAVQGQADRLALTAGFWFGMGLFQLIDGTLFHKILQLHPVRESVSVIWPYDLAWIGSALLLMFIGWIVWLRSVRYRSLTQS